MELRDPARSSIPKWWPPPAQYPPQQAYLVPLASKPRRRPVRPPSRPEICASVGLSITVVLVSVWMVSVPRVYPAALLVAGSVLASIGFGVIVDRKWTWAFPFLVECAALSPLIVWPPLYVIAVGYVGGFVAPIAASMYAGQLIGRFVRRRAGGNFADLAGAAAISVALLLVCWLLVPTA